MKPPNLYWFEGAPAIGDFGLAHFLGKAAFTIEGRKLGPAYFLAPEMVLDSGKASPGPADVGGEVTMALSDAVPPRRLMAGRALGISHTCRVGRRQAVFLLVCVATLIWVLAASVPVTFAQARTGPRLIGPDSVAFTETSLDPTQIRIANGEVEGPLHALISGDISDSVALAAAKPRAGSACPDVGEIVTDSVPAGDLVSLWVIPCEGGEDFSGTLKLWGATGDVIEIAVTRSTSVSGDSTTLSPPKSVNLRGDVDSTFSRNTCLPEATTEQDVLLSGDDQFAVMRVEPNSEDTSCSPGASYTLTANGLTDAGTYAGTIDLNGEEEGGEADATIKVRRSIWTFLLAVLIGVALASLISLLSGPVRANLRLDHSRWSVRRRVWNAQEQCLKQLKTAFGRTSQLWKVVSPSHLGAPDLLFDIEIARLESRNGFLGGVPADHLPGGAVYREIEGTSRVLVDLLRRASRASRRYSALAKRKPDSATITPTLGHLERLLLIGDPAVHKEDLEDRLKVVEPLLDTFEGLLSEVTQLSKQKGEPTLASGLLKQLFEVDLTDADAAKDFDTDLETARGKKRGIHTPGVEAGTSEGGEVVELDSLPAEKEPRAKTRTIWNEIAVFALSLVAAFLIAYATLYSNNPTWGSEGDLAAAVTWAFGVGEAIQVVRHVNIGQVQ